MKKVLLISPSYPYRSTNKKVQRFDPPLGLLFISSAIKDIAEVTIVNLAFESLPTNFGDYDLIGLTVFIGDFTRNAQEITAKIKIQYPELPVVWGGPLPTMFPEQVMANYTPDIIIRGEGEVTFRRLVLGAPLSHIFGISYREQCRIIHNPERPVEPNINNYPVPDWGLFRENYNSRQVPYYTRIHSSRGCPFGCKFCGQTTAWRARSAEHVLAEIDNCKAPVVSFGDDNFLLNTDRAIEIFNGLRERGVYVEQLNAHLNNLKDPVIKAMEGLVRTVTYSIESADPETLRRINKHIKLDKIAETNRKLYDAGITTQHSFIVGWEWEDYAVLENNELLMTELKKVNPYVRAVAYLYLPLPGTPLYEGTLDDFRRFERANFGAGLEFRPWLEEEDHEYLLDWIKNFDRTFRANSDPDVPYNELYILNDVLEGKPIDFNLKTVI